jgi:hypothetical protein
VAAALELVDPPGCRNSISDPLGFATHRYADPTIFTEELRPLAEILARLPHLYLSYWAWFATVPLHPLTYTVFGGLALAALGGWALGIRRLAADRARLAQAAVLALMIAGALAGLLRWMGQLSFTGGRLLYPAHAAWAIGLAGGLALLGWRFPRLDPALRAAATNQAYRYRRPRGGARYQLLFPLVRVNFELGVIMVIAVSCVKLLSAHNSTQHTSRKHKV